MLMDKGYYDYDYTEFEEEVELTAEDKEIWSTEKLNAILGVKPMTAEDMQRVAMEENEKQRINGNGR